MTTRLTLILVAALASAPVVFEPNGFRVHLNPVASWIVDRDETMHVESPGRHARADCVVIGSNHLQPYRVPSTPNMLSNRPIGLASGGTVACANPARKGS